VEPAHAGANILTATGQGKRGADRKRAGKKKKRAKRERESREDMAKMRGNSFTSRS